MTGDSTPTPSPVAPTAGSASQPVKLLGSVWRWLRWGVLAALLLAGLCVAAVFALRTWLLPDLTVLQPRIEAAISKAIAQPVRLSGMGAQWGWASADVHVDAISIGDAQAPVLQAKGLTGTVLAYPLLWGAVQTEGLSIASLTLAAQQTSPPAHTPSWRVAGLELSKPSDGAALRWLLKQPRLALGQLDVQLVDAAKLWLPEGKATVSLTQLALDARGLSHTFKAQFAPTMDDARLGKSANLEAHFSHALLGDLASFKQWSGQAHIQIPNAHIARSASWVLPLLQSAQPTHNQSWQHWAQRSAVDARLNSSTMVQFDAGKLRASGSLSISGLPTDSSVDAQAGMAPVQWSWKPAHAKGQGAGATSHAIQLGSDTVSIAPVLRLLQGAPLPAAVQSVLVQSHAKGTLSKVLLDAVIDAHGVQSFTANADAQQLGISSVDIPSAKGVVNIPTLAGVSGHIRIKHTPELSVSTVRLDSRGASAQLPRFFESPNLVFDEIRGEFEITLKPQSAALNFKQLRFSNPDAAGEINGQYTVATSQSLSKTSHGVAQLTGQLSRANLAQLHRYLPLALSDTARSWLKHTLAAGDASHLQFALHGDVSRFPFLPEVAQAGERFELQADLANGTLNFNPLVPLAPIAASTAATTSKRWPLIEQVAGQLKLEGLTLTLLNMQGTAAKIPLQVPKLGIANVSAPVVQFQTRTTAPAQLVLDVVRTTPLSKWLGEQFAALKASGTVHVDARLNLDIATPSNNRHQANITADQATLDFSRDLPPFERINAKLSVVQSSMHVEQATAFWLDGLVQLSGDLDTQDASKRLLAQGTAQLDAIKRYSPNAMAQALLKHAQGTVDYALNVSFKPAGVAWQVDADFKNTALHWPGLLGKAVGVALPLTLSREPTQLSVSEAGAAGSPNTITQDTWQASLGASLLGPFKANIERQLDQEVWRLVRGAVALGDAAELNAPAQGLGIHIATDTVNLDQLRREIESLPWASLPNSATQTPAQPVVAGQAGGARAADSAKTAVPAPVSEWMPSVLAVQVGDLTFANRHFYGIAGAAVRELGGLGETTQGHRWSANLVAKGINGYFSWIDTSTTSGLGGGAFVAKLEELSIPSSEVEQASSAFLRLSPAQVPSIDIQIARLRVADKALGNITLKASNLTQLDTQLGWNIESLILVLPHASMHASGQWLQAANARDGDGQVSLAVAFKTDSLGDTLDDLGYGKLVAGTAGKIDGTLAWRGTPFSMAWASLSGQFEAAFEAGRFLKIDPGAGKLVGLFSLQNLPRRLTLDFKDTFGEGFAFDSIQSKAQIAQGVLSTDDFLMNGTVAQVSAKGEVSLVHETQALSFVVKPDINAGSVSLLYMLINPPIGLATLVAQYLLKEPISKALTLEYAITGTWAKPDVQQLKRAIQ